MEPKGIANAYYEALGRNDLVGVAATLRADCTVRVPGAVLEGPEQTVGWMQAFFDAFPDITHEVGPLDVDADRVSTTVRVRGNHTGPLRSPDGELPPTGKAMDLAATNVMRTDGDRIAEIDIDFDQADFMRQLGVG